MILFYYYCYKISFDSLLLGPYIFAISVSTYLFSKEIYVLEHEYYNGIAMLIICVAATKMFGPKLAQFLDKEIDKCEATLEGGRTSGINKYEKMIEHNKQQQYSTEGQKMIMDIKKENVKIQLEATYRERMMKVYQEV